MQGGTERKRMFEYEDMALCSVSHCWNHCQSLGGWSQLRPLELAMKMVQVYRRQGSGLVIMGYFDSLKASGSAL